MLGLGEKSALSGGLGLGLHIASEIAKAHGERLDVVSNAVDLSATH
jgi:signal transduction histidine kinase